MSVAKQIHPALGIYNKMANSDLEHQTDTIYAGVYSSGNFTTPAPPIDQAMFKAQLDRFTAANVAAADGGKKAIAESKKEREALIRMIRALGHHVESNCKDDMTIFLSSGFTPIQSKRTSQPVGTPHIRVVKNGKTGELIANADPVRNAHSFNLRYAVIGANGAPGTWTTAPFTNGRSMSVTGLTPGTNYMFQVQAVGSLGPSDWSDFASHMCM